MDENKLIKVMDFIREYSNDNGYTPSVREIGFHCGIKSTATVHSYLEKLQEKGLLNKADNKKRSVTIGKSNSRDIPLLGTVTAGEPIFAYENYEEYYSFPVDEFRGAELFMLRVKGTSMIKAGIFDGDKIIVRRQQTANDGEIVVALITDSDAATIKRFYHKNGKIILHPENDILTDFIYDPSQVIILGKVLGLIRNQIS